jgi:serine acetyltransferase
LADSKSVPDKVASVRENGRLGAGISAGADGQRDVVPPDVERGMSWLQLARSDYRVYADLRGDSKLKRRLLALPRIMLNPSLHLVILMRLANASPTWLHWLWRNILISKHSVEMVHRSHIGPGLICPHPFGIAIGQDVRIGARVVITHGVTLATNVGSYETPVVEDRVILLTGSKVFGGVTVGEGSLVGAGAVVDFDVPPDSVVAYPKSQVISRPAHEFSHGIIENLEQS